MNANRADYSVVAMCKALEISTSGFYAWLKRKPSKRAERDGKLTRKIRVFYKKSRGTYGSPRIHVDLREGGDRVGRKRVARLMKADGLRGVCRRRKPKTTVRSDARPAPDLVDRNFTAERPNQLWVADITYVPTGSGPLYLAVVLDVFSRRIVGWAMDSNMKKELVMAALNMATEQRRPAKVIHHSDQGSQYTSLAFGQCCREHGIDISMGSVGDCYDNAMCESFFATLECELLDRSSFSNHREGKSAIFEFLESWYNRSRRHSSLGYVSPMRFENEHEQSCGNTVENMRKIAPLIQTPTTAGVESHV